VQYHYRYAVDDPISGVINDRWEHRHGEYVKGAYSVLEPDGRLRIVDYEVDGPKGFHAVIRTQFPSKSFVIEETSTTTNEEKFYPYFCHLIIFYQLPTLGNVE
jgi:hypothetical protein